MRIKKNLSYDWDFVIGNSPKMKNNQNTVKNLTKVIVPHTPREEELECNRPLQSVMWYRRNIEFTQDMIDKKIFIQFDGVMIKCEVFFNGKSLGMHEGGYLPFSYDITDLIRQNKPNTLSVKVDNRDDKNIPPGKPTKGVDFLYYGGIYRSVWLTVTDKIYITDAITAKEISGGGVYLYETADNKEEELDTINARVHIANDGKYSVNVKVRLSVTDNNRNQICSEISDEKNLKRGKKNYFGIKAVIDSPVLWSPENPYLYNVTVEVITNNEIVDSVSLRRGIKSIKLSENGLLLNGINYNLRGVNRHQQYPYIGIAGSPYADYRDAYKLKRAGFNIVRLSHYPQSEAFYDACDELGLLVIDCVPGWQYCNIGIFQDNVIQNIKDMVRRDRNRACIAFWETSLNETGSYFKGAGDKFFIECKDTVYKELPYGNKAIVCGDTIGRKKPIKVNYDLPYSEHDEIDKSRHIDSLPAKKAFIREYGDYEFGGEDSTTRVGRSDGEGAMLMQAWNYQWSHNRNKKDCFIGDAIWEGIDHVRGMDNNTPISKSGILDIFRLPKFAYHFFSSLDRSTEKKMIFAPTYWNNENINVLPVYSNCDKVRLYINNEFIEERVPDNGGQDELTKDILDSKSGKMKFLIKEDLVKNKYWALEYANKKTLNDDNALSAWVNSCMYNGKNCDKIESPPFTFRDIRYKEGELRVDGIVNNNVVARHIVRTPLEADSVRIRVDYSGKPLRNDGIDFVFLYAEIIDKNGTILIDSDAEITFESEGGIIIGGNVIKAEAGIASTMVKTIAGADIVKVSASTAGLTGERRILKLEKV